MSYLKKKVMKRKGDKDYIPRHIEDLITQQFIDKLLYTANEEVADSTINPYSLDSKSPFRFESRYNHGVKSAPPAHKKTMSASKSMFEYEIMKQVGDDIETPEILNGSHSKINIHGANGDYYINTRFMRNLMKQLLHEEAFRPCKGGQIFVAIFVVDSRLLAENCIMRK